MIAPSPALAAVTVLTRGRGPDHEVFWVRRADHLAFLGGFWSFPGGRAEPGEAVLDAAARELAEETGIVLDADPNRFRDAGRTVTPSWAHIRFDATYFLVEAPPGASPDVRHAGEELTSGEWIRPTDALAAWTRGERLTSPVVVAALRALVPGLDGATERMRAELATERHAGRLWDLVPGIGIAMLRTPTLPPATHTNCYVVGGAGVVVIDPGSPYPEEQAALDEALDGLRSAGRRVREVWLTHHHHDHVGGAAALAGRLGVPIAAHPTTARLLAGRVPVARDIADGEVAVLPGDAHAPERRLRAVFTPGHSPGHLCFLEETTGFVVAGDMVAGIGTIVVDPDEGDMTAYLASLRRLRALPPRVLLPAHGGALTRPLDKLDEYVRHRLWREERVVAALAGRPPTPARDLVSTVYDDVPPAIHALAERSLLAHLIKLVRDGRVREADGGYALA